jgi:hypothetical protein
MVQSFHESMQLKGGKLHNIIADVCAFANTNGGTIYIGVSPDRRKKPVGINDSNAIATLQNEISSLISPTLNVEIDTLETEGKTAIRAQVPYGEGRPYAIDNTKIYVRGDDDTSMAIRDEIVSLVQQGLGFQENAPAPPKPESIPLTLPVTTIVPTAPDIPATPKEVDGKTPPRAGVEIVGAETRGDTRYFIMRDLRNGNIVRNVTKSSARRLWLYAIKQKETNPVRTEKIDWKDDIGLWRSYKKTGTIRYDLVQRDSSGLRVYYGATESGMHGVWQQFLLPEDQTD